MTPEARLALKGPKRQRKCVILTFKFQHPLRHNSHIYLQSHLKPGPPVPPVRLVKPVRAVMPLDHSKVLKPMTRANLVASSQNHSFELSGEELHIADAHGNGTKARMLIDLGAFFDRLCAEYRKRNSISERLFLPSYTVAYSVSTAITLGFQPVIIRYAAYTL